MKDLTNTPNTVSILQRRLTDDSFVYDVRIVDDKGGRVTLNAETEDLALMLTNLLVAAFGFVNMKRV